MTSPQRSGDSKWPRATFMKERIADVQQIVGCEPLMGFVCLDSCFPFVPTNHFAELKRWISCDVLRLSRYWPTESCCSQMKTGIFARFQLPEPRNGRPEDPRGRVRRPPMRGAWRPRHPTRPCSPLRCWHPIPVPHVRRCIRYARLPEGITPHDCAQVVKGLIQQ